MDKKNRRNTINNLPVFLIIAFFIACFPDKGNASSQSHKYGDVVMSKNSKKSLRSVTFRHWSHRDRYTCRLCHVDLEFSQHAGETKFTEKDNQDGLFCGACHNGSEAFPVSNCLGCHPSDEEFEKNLLARKRHEFHVIRERMPSAMYGDKIDWMQAEIDGMIRLKDSLPGQRTLNKEKMVNKRDEPMMPTLPGLPEIIFSHSKHVVWCGCGMCHPESFALITGQTKMSMKEIIEGKFCGRCHTTVAFPLNDCTRCHSNKVPQIK